MRIVPASGKEGVTGRRWVMWLWVVVYAKGSGPDLAEGHVWEDVRFVSCQYLRDLPNGPPIPEDAGTPPEP